MGNRTPYQGGVNDTLCTGPLGGTGNCLGRRHVAEENYVLNVFPSRPQPERYQRSLVSNVLLGRLETRQQANTSSTPTRCRSTAQHERDYTGAQWSSRIRSRHARDVLCHFRSGL
jgi:hypothetical protein